MLKRFTAILCLVLLGLAAAGCTRCGPIWDDWSHACRSDAPLTR